MNYQCQMCHHMYPTGIRQAVKSIRKFISLSLSLSPSVCVSALYG
jgi:hypothetical protein